MGVFWGIDSSYYCFFEEFGASRGDFEFGILQIVEIIGVSFS